MAIPTVGGVADVALDAVCDVDWANAVGASSVGRGVHRFASPAERNAAIPAPVRGMLAITTDTDTVWQATGTTPTWVPLLPTTQYRGAMLVPTTDVNGEVVVNFNPQFPTTLTTIVATIGFYAGFGLNIASPGAGANNVGFKARVYLLTTGAVVANTTIGLNYLAQGH